MYEAPCMERDEQRCFRCGRVLTANWPGYSCHHRQSRSVGPDTLDNRIMLCGSGTTGCHAYVHKHGKESRDNGWIVSRHSPQSVIADTPVRHHRLGLVLLAADGGIEVYRPEQDHQ